MEPIYDTWNPHPDNENLILYVVLTGLECPVCGYKMFGSVILKTYCGIDANNDIIGFCPRCYSLKMKELGIPEMRPVPKEDPQ